VPVAGTITDANTSEFDQLQTTLEADRLYVLDRGYAKYALLQAILDAKSGFVVRLRDNTVLTVEDERLLSEASLRAGVVRDAVVHLGSPVNRDKLRQPVRIVEVECTPHRKPSGRTGRGGPEQGETILLATDRLDLSPETISTIYQKRWAIEIFFRFFKHILGCRHLISHDENGLQLQLYVAIIACLLISIWTGLKPNKTVLKLMELHLMGWADEDELMDQLARLKAQAEKTKK
jgi:IS4 transposase